jgi:hypothetical protein
MQQVPLSEAQNTVLSMNSNRRVSYVFLRPDDDNSGKLRPVVVSEPPPDTALQQTIELVGKLTAGTQVTGEASFKDTQTIINLTQRTQAIVILRDSLFRLAEARANGFIDDDSWLDQYKEVLSAAKEIAMSEKRELEKQQVALKKVEAELEIARSTESIADTTFLVAQQETERIKSELAKMETTKDRIQSELRLAQSDNERKAEELRIARVAKLEFESQLKPFTEKIASLESDLTRAKYDYTTLESQLDRANIELKALTSSRALVSPSPVVMLEGFAPAKAIDTLRNFRATTTDSVLREKIDAVIKDYEAKIQK